MAESIKVLAQRNPSAASLEILYTVPSNTSTVASSVVVCNRGAATSFRLSIGVTGAGDNIKQYIAYDVAIGANITIPYVLGITMTQFDEFRVYATLATLSFSLFGVEVT